MRMAICPICNLWAKDKHIINVSILVQDAGYLLGGELISYLPVSCSEDCLLGNIKPYIRKGECFMKTEISSKKLKLNKSKCEGCGNCINACPVNEKEINIFEIVNGTIIDKGLCKQCNPAYCIYSCPNQALFKNDLGIVVVDSVECNCCGICIDACPFGAIFGGITSIIKCDLCNGQPQCVEACDQEALQYIDN